MFLQKSDPLLSYAKGQNAAQSSRINLQKGLNAVFWIGGTIIICLALLSFATQMTLADLIDYAQRLFGLTFLLLFTILVLSSIWSVLQLHRGHQRILWTEVGLQLANGISTLALTFTLLGISLGIGSLSEQPLTPDTVQSVIGQLTAQFSMAFMTTVLGLPTATLFRAWIGILAVKHEQEDAKAEHADAIDSDANALDSDAVKISAERNLASPSTSNGD